MALGNNFLPNHLELYDRASTFLSDGIPVNVVYIDNQKASVREPQKGLIGARIFQEQKNPTQKLIVILADGIRWDYLDDPDVKLKGFPRLANNGVKAEYLIPIYPSNSYPNWYSILTGLYAENHGFVENVMYDSERKELFLMSPHPNASHEHWWNEAEPIWITAEKRGVRSAVYWWDGCQVEIKGKTPTVCEPYFPYWFWTNVNQDTKNKLIHVLNDFQEDKYRLSLMYYEAVDAMGHTYGPKSKQCKQSVQDIDNIVNTLLDEISSRKLKDEVNIIIISDHGMTSSKSPKVKAINVSTVLDPNDIVKMLNKGAATYIRQRDKLKL
ncbi:ectonucleotide pyrophosphatase/phosphodiesterase family member 6-like [Limulus polyphemus]|uniref:glycerophosphocholine cholinephosphodiesterase n=1 Tax=Limulus polyphemus TaxID=6850 RepID=A0ABM1TEE9_LIMPO|nr:ectonucleotide pyrophosphatase/phosphodiesterase family member 6-like [Limulus polyphemus]